MPPFFRSLIFLTAALLGGLACAETLTNGTGRNLEVQVIAVGVLGGGTLTLEHHRPPGPVREAWGPVPAEGQAPPRDPVLGIYRDCQSFPNFSLVLAPDESLHFRAAGPAGSFFTCKLHLKPPAFGQAREALTYKGHLEVPDGPARVQLMYGTLSMKRGVPDRFRLEPPTPARPGFLLVEPAPAQRPSRCVIM